jgi:hypothetical protein
MPELPEHEFVRMYQPAIIATFMGGVVRNDPAAVACVHAYICTSGRHHPWTREYVAALWSWSVKVVRANLERPGYLLHECTHA